MTQLVLSPFYMWGKRNEEGFRTDSWELTALGFELKPQGLRFIFIVVWCLFLFSAGIQTQEFEHASTLSQSCAPRPQVQVLRVFLLFPNIFEVYFLWIYKCVPVCSPVCSRRNQRTACGRRVSLPRGPGNHTQVTRLGGKLSLFTESSCSGPSFSISNCHVILASRITRLTVLTNAKKLGTGPGVRWVLSGCANWGK